MSCQLSRLATNLDAIMQVFFKLRDIQHLVVDGLRAVNDKFGDRFLGFDLCLERDGREEAGDDYRLD